MFEWKEDYATGIESIDIQHKQLFSMADELYDMVLDVEGTIQRPRLLTLIKSFETYANNHFSDEEELLRNGEYPDLQGHLLEHRKFVSYMNEAHENIASSDKQQTVNELIKFMTHWVFTHVLEADQQYVPHMMER